MRGKIAKQIEKSIGAKILEASGLLALIKPLAKRAGTLTEAERRVLTDTAWQAAQLLQDARSAYWAAEDEAQKTAKMVRANGDLFQ